MVWLSDREKLENMITRFDTIHERDRQTDGQTDNARRQRPRSRIASRGNKMLQVAAAAAAAIVVKDVFMFSFYFFL